MLSYSHIIVFITVNDIRNILFLIKNIKNNNTRLAHIYYVAENNINTYILFEVWTLPYFIYI